jgi:hypothetical protein
MGRALCCCVDSGLATDTNVPSLAVSPSPLLGLAFLSESSYHRVEAHWLASPSRSFSIGRVRDARGAPKCSTIARAGRTRSLTFRSSRTITPRPSSGLGGIPQGDPFPRYSYPENLSLRIGAPSEFSADGWDPSSFHPPNVRFRGEHCPYLPSIRFFDPPAFSPSSWSCFRILLGLIPAMVRGAACHRMLRRRPRVWLPSRHRSHVEAAERYFSSETLLGFPFEALLHETVSYRNPHRSRRTCELFRPQPPQRWRCAFLPRILGRLRPRYSVLTRPPRS